MFAAAAVPFLPVSLAREKAREGSYIHERKDKSIGSTSRPGNLCNIDAASIRSLF